MKPRWLFIVLAIFAHGAVALVTHRWGLKVTLWALGVVALASWMLYTYSDSAMDRLYTEYLHFDDEMKREFLARATADVRAEFEKRERDEKSA